MKTNKNLAKSFVLFYFIMFTVVAYTQTTGGTHPGMDPGGMSVPIDGGILMALLAGGGMLTMLFKKKKEKE